MNDHYLTNNYLNALKKYIPLNSVCLFVGNLSFIGLVAALFGATKVHNNLIYITCFIKTINTFINARYV